MQEYQVTIGGTRYPLERPVFVLATENPIEQEGTHPLPEAQLDRFLFNVVIDYPPLEDERRIFAETTTGAAASVTRVANGADLEDARTLVRDLPVAQNVVDFALRLVRATRAGGTDRAEGRARVDQVGRGPPRGSGAAARCKSHGAGRRPPGRIPDDVRAVARPALRHRLLLNFQAEADGVTTDDVIDRLLEHVTT